MKRFVGLILAAIGLGGTIWGGVHVLTTGASTRLFLTHDWSLPAMAVGLIGVALLTVGLIWVRD
jgi:hypothetical protein